MTDLSITLSTSSEESSEEGRTEPEVVEGRKCPKCDSDLVIKAGHYGKFIGCGAYPKCKHIEPLEKPKASVVVQECERNTPPDIWYKPVVGNDVDL